MMDREALAWAAGFFDGEGHAGTILVGRSLRPRFHLSVTQYERTTLERFQTAVSGLGRLYAAKNGTAAQRWSAQNFEEAQASACLLWPWLSAPKRSQIAEAMRMYHAHYVPRARLLGECNPSAKLTAEQVADIRRRYVRYSHGDTLNSLSAEFGVSHATIQQIVTGAKWGQVA